MKTLMKYYNNKINFLNNLRKLSNIFLINKRLNKNKCNRILLFKFVKKSKKYYIQINFFKGKKNKLNN